MDIVEELRQNRESGAKRLVSEYKAGLLSLARRFYENEGDAEELVNATFAKVVENIDDYLERSAFFAWMCQIMTNEFKLSVRRKSNRMEVYPGVMPEVEDESAQEAIYSNLDASLLREAIDKLPKDIRKTLMMHYFLDLSVKDVARLLAIPVGTVKWRLLYARQILSAKLGAAANQAKNAAKTPGAKATLLALALCAITALGTVAIAKWSEPSRQAAAGEGAFSERAAPSVPSTPSGPSIPSKPTEPSKPSEPSEPSEPSDEPRAFSSTFDLSLSTFDQPTQQEQNMNKTTLLAASAALAMAVPLCGQARQAVTYIDYVQSTNDTSAAKASYVMLDAVKPTGKWKIQVDFSVETAGRTMAVFSSKYRASDKKRLCLYNIEGTYRLDMFENRQHSTGTGARANFRQTFVYDAGKLYLDGTLVTDASSENGLLTSSNCEPIAVFGDPNNAGFANYGKGKIYRVRMWDETGAATCDLRPCLDSSGVAALYDSVNDAIHYSRAAPFAAGEALPPEGVEFVEYVQTKRNNGASIGQWFNTGIVPEFGGRIELDCTPLNGSATYYGLWNTHDNDNRRLSLIHIGGKGLRCDTSSKNQTDRQGYNVRRTYAYDAGVFSVDGNVMKDSSAAISSISSLTHKLVLGATYDLATTTAKTPAYPSGTTASPDACNANFCAMRIYRFRYWNAAGNLKLDLRPAKDANGKAALYDTVNGRFIYHTFGGTGYTASNYGDYATLACGGPVAWPSATALEYVETAGDVAGGRQFFDTGVEPSGAAKFEMDFAPLENSADSFYAIFTDRANTSPDSANKLNLYKIYRNGLRFDVNGAKQQTAYVPSLERTTVLYNAGLLKYGNDTVYDHSAAAAGMSNPTNRLFLFASGKAGRPTLESSADSNFARARLYGMKIWDKDGGALLRDFEPRLDTAGVAGLYDKAGDKFYHSCSNAAVAGPRIGVPTAADIEAAADVLDDAVVNLAGSKLAARAAFAQRAAGSVVFPFAGKTVTADYARFPQSFATAASGGDTLVTATTGYAALGAPFSSAAGTSWSAVMRLRREAKGVGGASDTVLSLGTECDKDGVRIGFTGPEASRRLDVRAGRHQWPELGGVQAPAGEWFDLAVVADAGNSSLRVAFCRSGAEPVWMEKTFALDGALLTNIAARATWSVKLGGVAEASADEVGRISAEGKWTMFGEALEAFKGDVQSVALWSRALTDAEVLAAFSERPKTATTIVLR